MKKILFVFFSVTIVIQTYAQNARLDAIASSGGFFSNSSNSLSWTLGECVSETFISSGNTLTQGFQQSLYVVTSINQLTIEGISVKAYPNPVSDLINISVKTKNNIQNPVLVELFDPQGKTLFLKEFSIDLIQIDMSQYAGGIYLLKVANQKNQILLNSKIQKIH